MVRIPNLASRPFLNTRPVWVLTVVAGVMAAGFAAVDVHLYLRNRHDLAVQFEHREELQQKYIQLKTDTQEHLDVLAAVPWQTLETRVERFNLLMKERSFSWLDLLSDIERVMPYQVRLTDISPQVSADGISLGLEAVARSREAMLSLYDNLIADPSFSTPLPRREVDPESGTAIGYLFTLSVTYHPGGESQ